MLKLPGTNSTLNVGVLFALNDPYLRKKRDENLKSFTGTGKWSGSYLNND